jgi:SAM-dependent methyltransferase
VGKEGSVTLLEPSPFYLSYARREAAERRHANVTFLEGKLEDTVLPAGAYDLVLVRWVLSFVPDPGLFIRRIMPALRPGGILAVQDYAYEGLSLYPRGGPFERMPDVVRAYYRGAGGDPYVAARLPGIFRAAGLTLVDYSPTCLAGGPTSGVMEWGHRFFAAHVPLMRDQGLLSAAEADDILRDWTDHRSDPDALFFSPIVVDVAGRKS